MSEITEPAVGGLKGVAREGTASAPQIINDHKYQNFLSKGLTVETSALKTTSLNCPPSLFKVFHFV